MSLLTFVKSILQMAYNNFKIILFKMKNELSSRNVIVIPCISALSHSLCLCDYILFFIIESLLNSVHKLNAQGNRIKGWMDNY